MNTTTRQRLIDFDSLYDRARETKAERIERLLRGLGMKPTTINTAASFDYDRASAIAEGRK